MKKLSMAVRGLSYLLWTILYVLVAAWVGEGQWHDHDARLTAAFGFFLAWLPVGFAMIELSEMPKNIVEALLEDDA